MNLSESLTIIRQKAVSLKLPIKIVRIERNQDNNLIIYFESEGRVDFRDLAKELNEYFNEPVRLEQIGVRDVAKKVGGIGPCDREICCNRFIKKFKRVSNDMIAAQDISLSISQCTGLCGKLMCCLAYECPLEKLEAIREEKTKKKAKLAQKKTEEKIKEIPDPSEKIDKKTKEIKKQKDEGISKKTPLKKEKKQISPKEQKKTPKKKKKARHEQSRKSKKLIRIVKR